MAKIIQPSRRVETVSYSLVFSYVSDPSYGFSFDCDAKGQVLELSEPGRINYEKCVSNTHLEPIVSDGIHTYRNSHREPAVLKCDCNATLSLDDPMTNECACGAFYNGSGQALCHPRLWGEETGERFDDSGHPIL